MAQIEQKPESFQESIKKIDDKKKKSLIKRLVFVAILFSLVISYFFLPISRVTMRTIIGNSVYSEDEVLKIAQIGGYDSLYGVDTNKAKQNLVNHPLFENDTVVVKVSPLGLKITAEEIVPVITYGNKVYGSNAKIIEESLFSSEDPLIGEHLKKSLPDVVKLLNDPESLDSKVPFQRLCTNIRKFDSYGKENIIYASITSETFDFYLGCEYVGYENDYIKLSVSRLKEQFSDDEIIYMCSHDHLLRIYQEAMKAIKDKSVTSVKETIEGSEKNTYRFKVIRTINERNEVHYQVLVSNN